MKARLFLFAFLIAALTVIAGITSAQRRTETDKPLTGDFKITVKQSVSGNSTQSTTMIKGARERTETTINAGAYSVSTVNITQCDMKRTIQINDRARKYLITPMDSDNSPADDERSTVGAPAAAGSRRGGVFTITVNTIDTGERKEMLGYTARHLKRTTTMESSPDACTPSRMKIETDGWYINLEYGLSCPANQRTYTHPSPTSAGCRDRYVYKTTGPANIGFPLQETTTMYGADGSVTMTMTKEAVEISRQPLDAALFDVPAGYTEAQSQQEMFSMPPSTREIMARQQQNTSTNESPSSSTAAERVRVGVVDFNNKTKTSVATDELKPQLVAALTANGIDAISLNAISPTEAVTEAQAKNCTYILYTDIATLKTPSAGKKIGGMFGRATGVGSADAGKNEVRFDFRLVRTGSTSATTQSSASAKEDSQETAVSEAIRSEARAIADAIPRQ